MEDKRPYRDDAGSERGGRGQRRPKPGPPLVKNLNCPYDGHYCEQPACENCQFEKGL